MDSPELINPRAQRRDKLSVFHMQFVHVRNFSLQAVLSLLQFNQTPGRVFFPAGYETSSAQNTKFSHGVCSCNLLI